MDHSNSHHIYRQKRGDSAELVAIVAISYIRAHHKDAYICNNRSEAYNRCSEKIDLTLSS